MQLKDFARVIAILSLAVTTAWADPTIQWVDNGGSATLQVVPSGTGAIATEIYISADFDLTSAVLADAVTFDLANPGDNPFGGGTGPNVAGTTIGLQFDDPTDQAFGSYGSIVLASTAPVDFITVAYNGSGTISASGLVAEGGANFTGLLESINVGVVPGDADGDGFVGLSDLNILGANWGLMPATFAQGDFDGSGKVDLGDLNILGANWNPPPAVAVPEPAALALACVAGFGLVTRRK